MGRFEEILRWILRTQELDGLGFPEPTHRGWREPRPIRCALEFIYLHQVLVAAGTARVRIIRTNVEGLSTSGIRRSHVCERVGSHT